MFEVEGGDVANPVAHGFNGGADFGGQGGGGEDGQGTGLEADWVGVSAWKRRREE